MVGSGVGVFVCTRTGVWVIVGAGEFVCDGAIVGSGVLVGSGVGVFVCTRTGVWVIVGGGVIVGAGEFVCASAIADNGAGVCVTQIYLPEQLL